VTVNGIDQPQDDRDRARILAFWARVERILQAYAQRFSAVRTLHLLNREGFYLVGAAVGLLSLATLAGWHCIPNRWSYLLALPAVYYVVDSVLANTAITFISQQPIHHLRSVLLTLLNVLNVGLAYAVTYATQREAFEHPLSGIQSIYFSFVTLTTLGYGDIKPDGPCPWMGQLTVVLELITGLYLLACVLTVVVSWAQQRETSNVCSRPRTRVARPLPLKAAR
jgi:hypothetical protein